MSFDFLCPLPYGHAHVQCRLLISFARSLTVRYWRHPLSLSCCFWLLWYSCQLEKEAEKEANTMPIAYFADWIELCYQQKIRYGSDLQYISTYELFEKKAKYVCVSLPQKNLSHVPCSSYSCHAFLYRVCVRTFLKNSCSTVRNRGSGII